MSSIFYAVYMKKQNISVQLRRPLYQYDYPEEAKQPKTGYETCVLTCAQILTEKRYNRNAEQKDVYDIAVKHKAINPDGYVNSYERLALQIRTVIQGSAVAQFFGKTAKWVFTFSKDHAIDELRQGNLVIGFLGGHAVVLCGYNFTNNCFLAHDPNAKKESATPFLLTRAVKRYGFYEL